MAGVKYSKQREMIMEYLKSTTAHPTAETVYMNVRSTNPKLSLGTVYRNLKLLSEAGEIQRLSCGDGIDSTGKPVRCHSCTTLSLFMRSMWKRAGCGYAAA